MINLAILNGFWDLVWQVRWVVSWLAERTSLLRQPPIQLLLVLSVKRMRRNMLQILACPAHSGVVV